MRRKIDTKLFIQQSKKIHNNKYSYEKSIYVNKRNKILITCEQHGDFYQYPRDHMNGYGCLKCGQKSQKEKMVHSTKHFIEKSIKIHGNKYIYDNTIYKNSYTKVQIKCAEHGQFFQTPNSHLGGCGCKKCDDKYLDNDKFIKHANQIHNNRYDYSKTDYINSLCYIKIKCPIHGFFYQKPVNHLQGSGCQSCKMSHGQNKIYVTLNKYGIIYQKQKIFHDCRSVKNRPLFFDFYLPDFNVCIQYDGEQHFKPIEYFGGQDGFQQTQIRDNIKNQYCKNNNIKLIRIRYNENVQNIIKEIIFDKINTFYDYQI